MPETLARLRIAPPCDMPPAPAPDPGLYPCVAEFFRALGWDPADILTIGGLPPEVAMSLTVAMATLEASTP